MFRMLRRSKFNLSHENKLSCHMGKLVPILSLECLPGDSFRIATDSLIRFAPLISPVMHTVDVYFHYYFVPNRILWDNGKDDCWETFITGGTTGSEAPPHPTVTFTETQPGNLADYLDVPSFNFKSFGTSLVVDALPFRAYDMIYNHWYRDQNLQEEVPISLAGGNDSTTSTTLLNRNWEKDYFTSAFPSPQRGTGVSIPLTGNAPLKGEAPLSGETLGSVSVIGNGKAINFDSGKNGFFITDRAPSSGDLNTPAFANVTASGIAGDAPLGTDIGAIKVPADPDQGTAYGFSTNNPFGATRGNLGLTGKAILTDSDAYADMSNVSSVNISDLRKASAIQRWLEKSMRFGSRYVEQLMSFFGVRPRDSRLQIPEYIGGFKSPILFSEVLQTSGTNVSSPQGNMAGHGFSAKLARPFKYFCSEHGWLLGIMSIMPRTNYMQGLPRKMFRFSRYDYFFPDFQNIGEQEILNKEIYAGSPSDVSESVFGYQQRYAEYKMIPSTVHGDFRSSLDYWHMAREFGSSPNLNSEFVTSQPTSRIFAVQNDGKDHIYAQILHHISSKRPMARYSKPSLR